MAAFGKRAKEWMTAHVPCHRVARHQPATSIELSSHHSRNTRSVVFDSQAGHANIEQHALPVGRGGSRAFALGVAFDRVVALHAGRRRCAAESNDDRDDVDIDLEQVEVARHLAQFLTLAGNLF
jgi:hypothetical protein